MKKHQKVNFLIIGTQKAGTSALAFFLSQHPEIEVPKTKELHFFNNETIFSSHNIDYGIYERQFTFAEGISHFGEATPFYMYWKPCMGRIKNYNPNMRIIVVLRNPAERAFSSWNMQWTRKVETKDFFYCIKNEDHRLRKASPSDIRKYSYVSRGFYAKQIKHIFSYFNREQIHFIKYEEFSKLWEAVLNDVLAFLQVSNVNFGFKFEKVLHIPYVRQIRREEWEYMIHLFINDIEEVENMLDWNCSDWKEPLI